MARLCLCALCHNVLPVLNCSLCSVHYVPGTARCMNIHWFLHSEKYWNWQEIPLQMVNLRGFFSIERWQRLIRGVNQGSVEDKICLTFLHMASNGNRTPDLLILSPMPYPLGHMISLGDGHGHYFLSSLAVNDPWKVPLYCNTTDTWGSIVSAHFPSFSTWLRATF